MVCKDFYVVYQMLYSEEIGSQSRKGEPEAWIPGGSSQLHIFSVDWPARGTEVASLQIARTIRTLVYGFTQSQLGSFV